MKRSGESEAAYVRRIRAEFAETMADQWRRVCGDEDMSAGAPIYAEEVTA